MISSPPLPPTARTWDRLPEAACRVRLEAAKDRQQGGHLGRNQIEPVGTDGQGEGSGPAPLRPARAADLEALVCGREARMLWRLRAGEGAAALGPRV